VGDVISTLKQRFKVGPRIKKDYNVIGALDGCGVNIDGKPIEIYEYENHEQVKGGLLKLNALMKLVKMKLKKEELLVKYNLVIFSHENPKAKAIKEMLETDL